MTVVQGIPGPRRVVVTGAASGIGRETVRLCLRRGAAVLACDLSAKGLGELEREGAEVLVGDVTRRADREQILGAAGAADGLVNAAGMIRLTRLAEVDDEAWEQILAVNLRAAFYLARDLGGRMAPGGSIVNVCSVAARRGENEEVLCYAASKAALLAVTRSLAHALGGGEVRVNAVLPGLIDTPMQDGVLDRIGEIRGVPRATLETSRLASVPLGHRIGSAEECAAPIVFLLSDAASYITGQGLSVDGGIVMI